MQFTIFSLIALVSFPVYALVHQAQSGSSASIPSDFRQCLSATKKKSWWRTYCDDDDEALILQAWPDALDFAKAVGKPDNIDFDGWLERDYYGVTPPSDPQKEVDKEYLQPVGNEWHAFETFVNALTNYQFIQFRCMETPASRTQRLVCWGLVVRTLCGICLSQ